MGYHLFWVRRVCPVRSQPGHSGPTGLGLRWCSFPYPVPKTAHRATQGRVWFSPLFPGALLVRQGCQTLGSNAFMHSLFNTSFGKPHSLFPPPQMLRWPLPRFWISKRPGFLPALLALLFGFIPPDSGRTASRYLPPAHGWWCRQAPGCHRRGR